MLSYVCEMHCQASNEQNVFLPIYPHKNPTFLAYSDHNGEKPSHENSWDLHKVENFVQYWYWTLPPVAITITSTSHWSFS